MGVWGNRGQGYGKCGENVLVSAEGAAPNKQKVHYESRSRLIWVGSNSVWAGPGPLKPTHSYAPDSSHFSTSASEERGATIKRKWSLFKFALSPLWKGGVLPYLHENQGLRLVSGGCNNKFQKCFRLNKLAGVGVHKPGKKQNKIVLEKQQELSLWWGTIIASLD